MFVVTAEETIASKHVPGTRAATKLKLRSYEDHRTGKNAVRQPGYDFTNKVIACLLLFLLAFLKRGL